MPQFTVKDDGRLLDILKAMFTDWKQKTLRERLKNGLVTVDGLVVHSGAAPVRAGAVVELANRPVNPDNFFPDRMGEPPLPILYADDQLLAIDKPSGLLSVASEREHEATAVHLMRQWLANAGRDAGLTAHAAHRLDRDASGVLLLARSLEVKRKLARNWHTFLKTYLAVTDGAPTDPEGVIDVPLWEDKGLFVREAKPGAGENADTRYRVMRSTARRSLLEVDLGTGRKHQIRVHLAHIGCPIVGDTRYGVSKARRLCLHAHILRVTHPEDGRVVKIVSPMPAMFRREMERR